jgi:hypothetical protein
MLNKLVALSLQVQVDSQASDSETLPQPKSEVIPGPPCSVNGHGHACSMLRHKSLSWQQEQDLLGTGGMFWEGTIAQMEAAHSIEASPFRRREGRERLMRCCRTLQWKFWPMADGEGLIGISYHRR